jgi:NodT family efflux transporter outer membrane factor (OMF) lipoprotein
MAQVPQPQPGLPSTLLERRPDIAAAERRAAAANAEIGVARAAWFPTISLTGSAGFDSAHMANLFEAPSHFWSLGPQAVMTLFDAGAISALNDQARAAYDQSVASYRETVLEAYQAVEDNLAAMHHLVEERQTQEAATTAAERALKQANDLYKGGATTFLDVVIAQNAELQARLAKITILTRQLTASVQLTRALGGGWETEKK